MDNYLKAINVRESRREYVNFPIEKDKVEHLQSMIDTFNSKNIFKISLILNDEDLFKSFLSSYGLLDGVRNYFALVCKKNDTYAMNMLGYYGEMLVLEATNLGLGTCWISGSYDKNKCKTKLFLNSDEELVSIISVGYAKQQKGLKESFTHSLAKRRTKDIKEMYVSSTVVPETFINGMKAVQKAPSAANKQPVIFKYENGEVRARINGSSNHNQLDLGIALLHFKIGSETINDWQFIDNDFKLVL